MVKRARRYSDRKENKKKKKGWWSRFLTRLAKANRELGGSCRH
jgi:hypothetical protein